MNRIAKNAITSEAAFPYSSCDKLKLEQIYFDGWKKFITITDPKEKLCIGSIYQHATMVLRNKIKGDFEDYYNHAMDVIFYYKAYSFRNNFRKCHISKYVKEKDAGTVTVTSLFDLLECSIRPNNMEMVSFEKQRTDCENTAKNQEYKGEIKLMEFKTQISDDKAMIEAFGKAYLCVVKKNFKNVKIYSEDIDPFYQNLDFGAFRLSHRECMRKPERNEVIQKLRKKKTFNEIFFGNLKKCINQVMAEIEEGKFPEQNTEWDKIIDDSMKTFRPFDE